MPIQGKRGAADADGEATATADPAVVPTGIPAAEPTPTPTPALPEPRPLAELVVPTAMPLSLTPTPTPQALSPMEDRLAQDEKRLEVSLGPIVADANKLDAQFQEYVTSCFQKFTTQAWQAPSRFDAADSRHWFTLLDPQPTVHWSIEWLDRIEWQRAEKCQDLWQDMTRRAPLVMARVDALHDDARRAGVLPGSLRALLKKHRLAR